jgi:hypothetical protein
VGENTGSSIDNSYATGKIEHCDNSIGGLVGLNLENSSVGTSYATGAVSGVLPFGLGYYVGGLVGWNFSTITSSYATGEVEGQCDVGGFVGRNDSSIHSSYTTGSVTGGTNTGGFVGNMVSGSINSAYSTGLVSSLTGRTGGFIGYKWGSVTSSYWNTENWGILLTQVIPTPCGDSCFSCFRAHPSPALYRGQTS